VKARCLSEKAEVHERLETQGQQRSRRLRVPLRILLALAGIIAATIAATSADTPGEKPQLPAVLRQWERADQYSSTEPLRAFKRGVDFYASERYASALDALPGTSDAKATAVGDYIVLYRAKSHFLMSQYKEALEDFRLIEKRYPNSSLGKDSLMGQCQALLGLNDGKSVLAILSSHKADKNSETLYYRARALDSEKEKSRAIELYLQIYAEYPASKHSPLAERSLVALSPGALKGVHNYALRLQRAENLLKANDLRGARTLLSALGRVAAPDSRSFQKRSLLLAEAEYRLGRTTVALSSLDKVTAADPVLHAKSIYLAGACNRKLDKEQSFLALRDKGLKLYPASGDTEELCYSAATYYDVNYNRQKSREAYSVLYQAFPNGRHAEIALWKLSLFSYLAGQYSEAAAGFWKYLRAYPNPPSAVSAMYWMGRCYEKLGDTAKAKYLYRRTRTLANESYYGRRAQEAEGSLKEIKTRENAAVSGLDFKQVTAFCDGIAIQPAMLAEPDENGLQVIERARQLAAADLPDLALAELRWGIRRYPQNEGVFYCIMSLIHVKKRNYDESISCLRRVFPDYNIRPVETLYEEVWPLLFPVLHWETISRQAARTGIDPTLILGVIRQESAFEEKARSKANAYGLMQILPSTGRKLAKQAKIARFTPKSLFQAETNIVLGTQFLASLLQQYDRTEFALAAYNAGETRVDRWRKEFGAVDMAEFVEQIPFSETRGYVKQVLSNKAHYDLLASPAAR
jgi:soluble lytic murein transglycosylase